MGVTNRVHGGFTTNTENHARREHLQTSLPRNVFKYNNIDLIK